MDFDVKQDLHILTIKDAVMSDEGSYKLKISNEKGSVQVTVMVTAKTVEIVKKEVTEEVKKEVKEEVKIEKKEEKKEKPKKPAEPEPCEPKIEVAPEPVDFNEGETVTLSCKISG